ncbi:MAG: hypothetical protein LBD27_03780 [Tannerella sp.]|nr:hypothetical protein [Tannerella sp.]
MNEEYNNHRTAGIPVEAHCVRLRTFHLSPDLSPQGRGGVQRWSGCVSLIRPCSRIQRLNGEARYTYIYCFSKSRLPSLVERGWGRGAMPSDTAAGIRLPLPL